MQRTMMTVILSVGLLASALLLVSGMSGWRLPDNQQGYSPRQPIDYSHRLHAGELGIDCLFCHGSAPRGRHAGIPSSDTCMKCHEYVTSSFASLQQEIARASAENRKPEPVISPELRKLYESCGLVEPGVPDPERSPESIRWVRVHKLPDFVTFDHSAHVTAGVTCQKCHGAVESMERVRQVETLSMGWCVDCHRESAEGGAGGNASQASLACTVCHH